MKTINNVFFDQSVVNEDKNLKFTLPFQDYCGDDNENKLCFAKNLDRQIKNIMFYLKKIKYILMLSTLF